MSLLKFLLFLQTHVVQFENPTFWYPLVPAVKQKLYIYIYIYIYIYNLPNQIKKQDLAKQQLLCVFDTIINSRITYAAAAWRGFATVAECYANYAIQAFLKRSRDGALFLMT